MSTVQSLTSRINDVLDAGAATGSTRGGGAGAGDAELEHLANEYARLSADVNARLRRCLDFLRRGLRSEAIQYAHTDPELFALIQSLHIRRVEEWDNLCRDRGLERPRPLLLEAAKALNEAYEVERKLEPLLRRHRTLALARAPLQPRIEVLRRIHELDARNPNWIEDLRALEVARLTEIGSGLSLPGLELDRAQAEAVLDELTDPARKVKPDPGLLRKANTLVSQARMRWAEQESRRLLPALHAAHAALDLSRCRELMTQWDAALMSVGVKLGDLPEEIVERWRPVASWVAGEQDRAARDRQHAQVAAQLREAIESRAALPELESLHRRLVGLGRPADEPLERDYAQAVQGLQLVERRQRRMRILIGAAAAIVVLAAVALGAYDLVAARQAEQRLQDVAAAAAKGDVALARTQHAGVVDWEPLVFGRGAWRSRVNTATQTLAGAEDRSSRFTAAMQAIEAADPAGVSDDALAGAASLALTGDERQAVDRARAAALQAREDTLRRRDAEAIARITAIAAAAQALDPARLEPDAPAFSADLARLEAELDALRVIATERPAVGHAMAAVAAHVAGLREMTDRAIATQQHRAAAAEALRLLPGRAYSAEALSQALSSFVERHPDDPHAAAFAEALQLSGGWRGVEAWTRLTEGWRGDLSPRDRTDAARRIVAIEAYLAEHPDSPLAPLVASYRDRLGHAVLLLKEDGAWQAGILRTMRTPVMAELNAIQTRDGRRYYTVGDGGYRLDSLGAQIDVVLTPDLSRPTSRIFPVDDVQKPRPSPQRELSQAVLQLLRSAEVADADTLPLRVVQLVAEATEVDPILRAFLLSLLVADAKSADEAIEQELAEWSRPIAGFDLEHVPWMNPEDAAAAALRVDVAAALDALAPLQPRIDAQRTERAALYRELSARAVASGVILREDGTPKIATTVVTPASAQSIEAVARRSILDTLELRRIGVVEEGQPVLDPAAIRDVPDGSLVFFVHHAEGN